MGSAKKPFFKPRTHTKRELLNMWYSFCTNIGAEEFDEALFKLVRGNIDYWFDFRYQPTLYLRSVDSQSAITLDQTLEHAQLIDIFYQAEDGLYILTLSVRGNYSRYILVVDGSERDSGFVFLISNAFPKELAIL